MGSFFLFVFAVWFIVVTFPIWFILSLLWCPLIIVIKYIGYFSHFIKWYISVGNYGEGLLGVILSIPIAIWDGIVALLDPISFAWDFARYDHPFWAFLISVCLTIIYANSLKNKG